MRGIFIKIIYLCLLAAFAQACSPAVTTPPEAAASKTTTIVKSGSTDTGVNDDLTLKSINPSSQFVGGAIFIKGTGLNKAVGFFIGDGEASDFFAVDSKNIILVVPTDATSGDVMAYDIDGNFSLLESGFTLLTSSGGSSSSSTSNSSSSDSSSASPSPSSSPSSNGLTASLSSILTYEGVQSTMLTISGGSGSYYYPANADPDNCWNGMFGSIVDYGGGTITIIGGTTSGSCTLKLHDANDFNLWVDVPLTNTANASPSPSVSPSASPSPSPSSNGLTSQVGSTYNSTAGVTGSSFSITGGSPNLYSGSNTCQDENIATMSNSTPMGISITGGTTNGTCILKVCDTDSACALWIEIQVTNSGGIDPSPSPSPSPSYSNFENTVTINGQFDQLVTVTSLMSGPTQVATESACGDNTSPIYSEVFITLQDAYSNSYIVPTLEYDATLYANTCYAHKYVMQDGKELRLESNHGNYNPRLVIHDPISGFTDNIFLLQGYGYQYYSIQPNRNADGDLVTYEGRNNISAVFTPVTSFSQITFTDAYSETLGLTEGAIPDGNGFTRFYSVGAASANSYEAYTKGGLIYLKGTYNSSEVYIKQSLYAWRNEQGSLFLAATYPDNMTQYSIEIPGVFGVYVNPNPSPSPSASPSVSASPSPSPSSSTLYTQVSAGGSHTCALKNDNTVWCWGDNTYGQLGNNSNTLSAVPTQVIDAMTNNPLTNVSSISTGLDHTCAITSGNYAYCWGKNNLGQLGNDSTQNRNKAEMVTNPTNTGVLDNIVNISAGGEHTCAVTMFQNAYCWGSNADGELGDGNTSIAETKIPVQVKDSAGTGSLSAVSSISLGLHHSCAVLLDNTAYCWGLNSSGQLGNNSTVSSSLPVQVSGAKESISAGPDFTCGTYMGDAWCWGANSVGQLGDGTTNQSSTPVRVRDPGGATYLTVPGGSGVIAAANGHACAKSSTDLGADFGVYCWGGNWGGALGDNTVSNSERPVNVIDGSANSFINVSRVTAGGHSTWAHSCVLKLDGTIWCWGSNDYGQIGIGSSDNTPHKIAVQISAP